MGEKNLLIAWYYHSPSVSTDDEIRDLVKTSLDPLLSIHARYEYPFTLAITGSLLARINKISEQTIEAMRKLIDKNMLEIAATYHYEIYPPSVPHRYIKLHIRKDVETKKELLDAEISTFYPPNFTWISILGHLLLDFGIRHVILDESNYRMSCKIQTWKWDLLNENDMNTLLIDTFLDRRELHKIYKYNPTQKNDHELKLFFRDFDVTKHLSFGNSGLFHRPFEWNDLDTYLCNITSKLNFGNCITMADDGDRVNSISLYNYDKFLRYIGDHDDIDFVTPSLINIDAVKMTYVPYLPSHSLGDHHSFWLQDLDSMHYLDLLNELYALIDEKGCYEDEVMDLQDVYFLFWKNIMRKKYYMDKLYELFGNFGVSD